jgi:hypothetical protein
MNFQGYLPLGDVLLLQGAVEIGSYLNDEFLNEVLLLRALP